MYEVKPINLFDPGYTRQTKEYAHDTCSNSMLPTKVITHTKGCMYTQTTPPRHPWRGG